MVYPDHRVVCVDGRGSRWPVPAIDDEDDGTDGQGN